MDFLIEKYVYAVIRRLPEQEREEVSRELKANIYDMLPDNPTQKQVEELLYSLGTPASLAEKYRQNPKTLISSAMYHEYIRLLKWIIPVAAGLGLLLGVISSAFDFENLYKGTLGYTMTVIGGGFSGAISFIFYGLFWTTLGCAIADRVMQTNEKQCEQTWKPSDLPEPPPPAKTRKIPLSDSIAEIVLTSIFCGVFLMICAGVIPIGNIFKIGTITIDLNIFTPSFLQALIITSVISCAINIAESSTKIAFRRWNLPVCVVSIISKVTDLVFCLYLLRMDIFQAPFKNQLKGMVFGDFSVAKIVETVGMDSIVRGICVVMIVIFALSCYNIIFKTLKKHDDASSNI